MRRAFRRAAPCSFAPVHTILLIVLSLLAAPPARSQVINGRFSTAAYAWEQSDSGGVPETFTLLMQNVQLDLSYDEFTLGTSVYGQTRFEGDGELRVRNLFVTYAPSGGELDILAGRVPVFAGVGTGAVDGAMVKSRHSDRTVRFTLYGGSNVPGSLVYDHSRELGKNYLVGGQVLFNPWASTRLGVSYVNRRIERKEYEAVRPDSFFNPVTVTVNPDSRAWQVGGVDLFHSGRTELGELSVNGRYDHDFNLRRSLRGEANLRAGIWRGISILANFIYREPSVPYNSWFTVFPLNPVREYEGGLEYRLDWASLFGRFAYVGYTDENTRRVTTGVNALYGTLSYSFSDGYAGDMHAVYAQAMVPLLGRKLVPMAAFSWAQYTLGTGGNEETARVVSAGAVVRPADWISFDGQVQFIDNALYEKDVRGLFKVSYWLFSKPAWI